MALNRERAWIWFIVFASIVYCAVEALETGDLFIYLAAAGELSRHGDIYVTKYVEGSYHFYYSVLFALFLKPFYYLPFYPVKLTWLLLNNFMFWHLMLLLWRSTFVQDLKGNRKTWFMFFVFLFSFRFYKDNIHTSQITILILWCSVYGLYLVHKGKEIPGALLIALAINIKLLPLLFLPYLLYRGFYKAFVFSLLFLVSAIFLPSVFIGHSYNMQLFGSWLNLVNPAQAKHILDVDERSFHGLSTLLSTLLVQNVPDHFAMNLKRNIADISLEQLYIVLTTVRLVLLVFAFYFVRSLPFKKAGNTWQSCCEIAYILLLVPLIFPHQQHYAFLFAAPAFAVSLYCFLIEYPMLTKQKRVVLITLFSVVYLLSNLKYLLGEFNHYYEHYKILTYGALLLIPLLAWAYRNFNPSPKLKATSQSISSKL